MCDDKINLKELFKCTASSCDCTKDPKECGPGVFFEAVDNKHGKVRLFCSYKVHCTIGGLDVFEENCDVCLRPMVYEGLELNHQKKEVCILCCETLITTLATAITNDPCLRYKLFRFKPDYVTEMVSKDNCYCCTKHPVEVPGEPLYFITKHGERVPLECNPRVLKKLSKLYNAHVRKNVHLRRIIDDWKKTATMPRLIEKAKRVATERAGAKRVLRTYLAPCVTDAEIDNICRVKRAFGMNANKLNDLAEKVDFRRFMKWLNKFRNECGEDN
jgi:hypothetical protein